MTTRYTTLPFTVTCETHDRAVLYCLRALREFAEPASHGAFGTAAGDVDAWKASDGLITFRFADVKSRDTFLGEATRLLSGKWIRMALSNEGDQ